MLKHDDMRLFTIPNQWFWFECDCGLTGSMCNFEFGGGAGIMEVTPHVGPAGWFAHKRRHCTPGSWSAFVAAECVRHPAVVCLQTKMGACRMPTNLARRDLGCLPLRSAEKK